MKREQLRREGILSVDALTRLVLWCLAVDPDVHWRVTYENGRSATEEPLERR